MDKDASKSISNNNLYWRKHQNEASETELDCILHSWTSLK